MHKGEQEIQELWGNITSIHLPNREGKKRSIEELFEEMMPIKFPHLVQDSNAWIRLSRTPSKEYFF